MSDSEKIAPKKFSPLLIFILVVAALYLGLQVYQLKYRYDISEKYNSAMHECLARGGLKGEIPIFTRGIIEYGKPVYRTESILHRAGIYINNGLEFVEFGNEVVNFWGSAYDRNAPYFKERKTPFNFYRVSIADKGALYCSPYEKFIETRPDYFDHRLLTKDKCLAIEGFDDDAEIRAEYGVVANRRPIDSKGIEINWVEHQIIRRVDAEVVASFNWFSECLTKMVKVGGGQGKQCSGIVRNIIHAPSCPGIGSHTYDHIKEFESESLYYGDGQERKLARKHKS